MKIFLRFTLILFFLIAAGEALADTIFLKNGKQISGVISRENPDSVELAIGIGTVKFYNHQIERIARSDPQESQGIVASWGSRQQAADTPGGQDASLNPREEIKAERLGDHLLVNAVINAKARARLLVDTGASVVMLSRSKARELGIGIKDEEKADAKMKLADGSEVEGKLLELKSVAVGISRARDVAAAVILSDESFKDFDGLLGMSYLKFFKFEIDLANSKLVLQEPLEEERTAAKKE